MCMTCETRRRILPHERLTAITPCKVKEWFASPAMPNTDEQSQPKTETKEDADK